MQRETDTEGYEPPYRVLRHLAQAVADAIERQITEHELRAHLPMRRGEPLQAIPFPGRSLPDAVLAQVQETIEIHHLTDEAACARYAYPPSLLQRELVRYRARYRRWLEAGAE